MKTTVGLWIDHRKALIAAGLDKGEKIQVVESKVGKPPGDSVAVRSTVHHEPKPLIYPEDSRQRKLTGQLNRYYDEVISALGDAESILIFGPGEAKGELKTRLESHKLGERIVAVEAADEMTENQIAAKVREYFKK